MKKYINLSTSLSKLLIFQIWTYMFLTNINDSSLNLDLTINNELKQ